MEPSHALNSHTLMKIPIGLHLMFNRRKIKCYYSILLLNMPEDGENGKLPEGSREDRSRFWHTIFSLHNECTGTCQEFPGFKYSGTEGFNDIYYELCEWLTSENSMPG